MKQIKKLFLIAVLSVFSTAMAWGTTTKVSSATASNNKNCVLAVYYNGDYYAIPGASTITGSNTYSGVKITLNTLGKVSTTDAANITWTLIAGSTSGQFAIKSGTKYLIKSGTTGATNYKINTSTTAEYWAFTQQSDTYSTYEVESKKSGATKNLFLTNNTTTIGCYGSTSSTITILEIGDASSSTPVINANDVEVAYNASNGSIAYTLQNGSGNVSANVTSGDWLQIGTISSSAVPFTCSTNPTGSARTATVTLSFSGASNKVVTVTQAANPNIFNNISDITSVGTAYKVKGTVVATNARGFVIGDGTGYVYTYLNASPSQAVNDMITIQGTTSSYGHIIQFTNSATVTAADASNYNNTPAVTVLDASGLAAYNSDYQKSDYVQFEGSLSTTTTTGNNPTTYYDIAVVTGNTTSNARISYPTSDQTSALSNLVGRTVRVKGYFAGFSSSYFTVMLDSVEEVQVPTITVTPNTLSGFTYEEGSGPSTNKTISVSGSNLTANISLSLPNDGAYEMSLSSDSNFSNSLTLTQTNGSVAATTIYVRLKAGKDAGDYNNVSLTLSSEGASNATVTLSGSVTEPEVQTYAELPFSYTSGKSGIAEKEGLYESGLGNDYASAPLLKFDGDGDYVLLQFEERPGTLSFSIKGNGSGSDPWAGTFKVLVSANGSSFDVLDSYTNLSSTATTKTYESLDASVRYIKWVYETKTTGNVALGALSLAKYVAPSPTITVTADDPVDVSAAAGSGELALTYEYFDVNEANDFAVQFYDANNEELNGANAPTWITVSVVAATTSGYKVTYSVNANDGAERSAYFKVFADAGEDFVFSNKVTITQAEYEAPPIPDGWVETSLASLTADDVFIIVCNNGSGLYALPNNGGTSNPSAYELSGTIPNKLKWNVSGNASDGYVFYPNGTNETWLYCTNSNQGVRIGTNDNKLFSISDGYLMNTANNRYVGVYDSKDWRCYDNTNGNIAGQTFAFYKKVTPDGVPSSINVTAVLNKGSYWATFYHATAQYVLPEGAQAFTLNADHQLYRLGNNGRVIPEGTAVIIISEFANIQLVQKNAGDGTIHDISTAESPVNILRGSNTAVDKSGITTGTPYVLGISADGTLGFYEISGDTIPANKAYIVE